MVRSPALHVGNRPDEQLPGAYYRPHAVRHQGQRPPPFATWLPRAFAGHP